MNVYCMNLDRSYFRLLTCWKNFYSEIWLDSDPPKCKLALYPRWSFTPRNYTPRDFPDTWHIFCRNVAKKCTAKMGRLEPSNNRFRKFDLKSISKRSSRIMPLSDASLPYHNLYNVNKKTRFANTAAWLLFLSNNEKDIPRIKQVKIEWIDRFLISLTSEELDKKWDHEYRAKGWGRRVVFDVSMGFYGVWHREN